jgi:large subunit ribosomal protein L31
MQKDIHPKYKEIVMTCSCGHEFTTRSTISKDSLHLDICSNCHPFYTGQQKMIDTAGRIDRFNKKYARFASKQDSADK